jgi:hypothetical protein
MYDYFLGGKNNYPADREAAERVIAMTPSGSFRVSAQQNRAWLGRVVRFMTDRGIRQFLDIGTGLPTMGNVHEIAQQAALGARVVYVDNDPVVITHAHDMLQGVDGAVILEHDLRRPVEILGDPLFRELIDLDRPIGLLLIAILHFFRDEENPKTLVDELLAALPVGSYLAISHITSQNSKSMGTALREYDRADTNVIHRDHDEVEKFFDGLELLDPGVVSLLDWRPDETTGVGDEEFPSVVWCGVARKAR